MTVFKEENKDKRNRPNAGVIIYSLLIYLLEFALLLSSIIVYIKKQEINSLPYLKYSNMPCY